MNDFLFFPISPMSNVYGMMKFSIIFPNLTSFFLCVIKVISFTKRKIPICSIFSLMIEKTLISISSLPMA